MQLPRFDNHSASQTKSTFRWQRHSKKFFALLLLGAVGASQVSTAPSAMAWFKHKAKSTSQAQKNAIPISASAQFRGSVNNPQNPSTVAISPDFPDKQWWTNFHDDNLSNYIQIAITSNHTLAQAKARIDQSRAAVRSAFASMLPTLAVNPNYTRQKISANSYPPFFSPSAGSGGGGGGSSTLPAYNVYALPGTATYEADFFLKNWDKVRSAKRQAEASEQDYRTATIALITDVSSNYFSLIAADKLIALQKDYIKFSQADLDAEKIRQSEGLVSEERVAIKENILGDSKATLQDYFRQQAMFSNQLAVLMGRPPETVDKFPRADLDQFEIPQNVTGGLPAQLITRRPDILSAEKTLEAARINILVARKDFLPTFDLSGGYGFTSTVWANFIKKSSVGWSYKGEASQGLFEGGAKIANLRSQKALYEQQIHVYQQTILNALQDVDNALEGLKSHQNAYNEYATSNKALVNQLGYQQVQFDAGAIAQSDLYATQVEIIQSQEGLVQAKLLGLSDTLTLYKALGGGY